MQRTSALRVNKQGNHRICL